VWSGRYIPQFRKKVLPPGSGKNVRPKLREEKELVTVGCLSEALRMDVTLSLLLKLVSKDAM
jgi:hypothetical protein